MLPRSSRSSGKFSRGPGLRSLWQHDAVGMGVGIGGRFGSAAALMLLVLAPACGGGSSPNTPDASAVAPVTTADAAPDLAPTTLASTQAPTLVSDRFVLPESDTFALLDAEAAGPGPAFVSQGSFALAGSADDDLDGPRVMLEVFNGASVPTDDLIAEGTTVDVAGRPFLWSSDGENQRIYVGPTASGQTIVMITLNVEESAAVDLLRVAELTDGDVVFDGQPIPDGWVDTGTSTAVPSFLAGATGTSAPLGGTRSLYGDPNVVESPTWDNVEVGFGLTLATWPVRSADPNSEARYSLDGEVEVEVRRADGSTTVGFASAADTEFFEFVVWQENASWLALSRPKSAGPEELIKLAATVRVATPEEQTRLELLAAD
jgi:hypothetical protein